ncbi:recombinase family protein [Mameliella alba]|uniref:recombinase family protein n=1 Tax=Mameliella alba TaxID=561184 RepID=UPI003C6DB51B
MVWKLDRLGRSTLHLLHLLSELRDRGVDFIALTQDNLHRSYALRPACGLRRVRTRTDQ